MTSKNWKNTVLSVLGVRDRDKPETPAKPEKKKIWLVPRDEASLKADQP